MNKIWEIYFSPTGTTEKVVHKIGQSLAEKQKCETMTYSFTLPSARNSFPHIETEDLVIFGCPTYAGRLPNLLLKYLDTIEGNNAAAVAIVTYGNRHFDNSLSELCHILDTHQTPYRIRI